MPRLCCVICGIYNTLGTVFRFPAGKALENRWKRALQVEAVHPTSGVCAKHFAPDDVVVGKKRITLRHGAIPLKQTGDQPDEDRPSTSAEGTAHPPLSETTEPVADDVTAAPRRKPVGKVLVVQQATYERLQQLQKRLKCATVAGTVTYMTKRFLTSGAAGAAQGRLESTPLQSLASKVTRDQLGTPSSCATVEPTENTIPYSPVFSDYSFTPGSAAPTPRRDLAEAEMLEELDVSLELADDPSCAATEEELETMDDSELAEETSGEVDSAAGASPCWDVRSAVVSEPQLLQLLYDAPAVCPQCQRVVPPHISRRSLSYRVTWMCGECEAVARTPWDSTEKDGQAYVIDTVFAGALTLSGCSIAGIQKLMTFANLGKVSSSALHRLNNKIVYPVIDREFSSTMATNRAAALEASPGGLVLAGDCQNDSPGFSASYGTYTTMDHHTGRIVAQHTVARQEVGMSSPREEVEGAKRCLMDMKEAGVPVSEFVSDQHVGVKKVVETMLPGVRYSFDIWHAAKNVGKRLNAYAVKAKYKKLRPWVSHLKNHFWWCAKTSDGNDAIFRKRWAMAVHHVCDEHVTGSGINACHHGPLDDNEKRSTEWLQRGSDAHKAVQDVVLSPRTLGLSRYVASFRHTGQLEVFHSLSNAYTPKLKFFTYGGFVARKRVAVLDYTAHLDRPFQRNDDGTIKTKRVYSRVSDKYVLRPLKAAKTFPHVKPLLAQMTELRRKRSVTGSAERRPEDPRRLLPHVHRAPRADETRESLEASRLSRF